MKIIILIYSHSYQYTFYLANNFNDIDIPRMAAANYVSATATDSTVRPAALSCKMFAQWLILSFLVTSKGPLFIDELTQSIATAYYKMRAIVPSDTPIDIFAMTMQFA